jgi:pyruvate-formate lyase-activating enzyme
MGEYKWKELGLTYTLSDTKEPEKALIKEVKEILEANGKNVSTSV